MRIIDWSSDVCSSESGSQVFSAGASVQADKSAEAMAEAARILRDIAGSHPVNAAELATARNDMSLGLTSAWATSNGVGQYLIDQQAYDLPDDYYARYPASVGRSEEHTSELQSLMRISYAVFCLKKKNKQNNKTIRIKYNEQN